MSTYLFRIFFALLLVANWLACQRHTPEETVSQLGEVNFRATGSEAAQPAFHEGLLLLHSFEYDDAKAAFVQAQEQDPDMAMAYWGEAMTYNHPLWRQQDREAARKALEKLAATPEERQAKAGNELEADLIAAADILYGEGEKVVRDSLYATEMEQLYEKYPGQQEVAAFYALSLLGAVPVGRDYEVYGTGAQIAKSILQENPNHPGALHYLIHAYDDPGHAAMAIKAANSYAQVAPDAAHALHMPSHIYVAMGMWDDVVNSNIASYQASVDRMDRLELDNDARSYHAFAWLMYGHLQRGEIDAATKIMNEMVQYTEELPSKRARSYLNLMKGNFLVETGDWEGEFAGTAVEVDDLNIAAQAANKFLYGMQAFRKGDRVSLEKIIKELEDRRQGAAVQVSDRGTPMCSVVSTENQPNRLDLGQAKVMELELRALYARLLEKTDMADQLYAEAAELENSLDYSYGPPEMVYPSFELYGEWLLEQGRPEEAMAQFENSLKRGPRRVKALKGKLSAAEQLNDQRTVRAVKAILEEIATGMFETS